MVISGLVIGIVSAVTAVVGALGAIGTGVAISNKVSLNNMEAIQHEQNRMIKQLQEEEKYNNERITNLTLNFNEAVKSLQRLEDDHIELKQKTISTTYAISYITSKLILGKSVIKEATRQWRSGKIHEPFLDSVNFTMPCLDKCPLHLATPQKCSLNDDRTIMFMDFTAPLLNDSLVLVEADPFHMMGRKENLTCAIRYTGPTNAVLSKKEKCVFGMNLRPSTSHDLILSPTSGCKPSVDTKKETKYFALAECSKTHPYDEIDFIQVKPYFGKYYIYCPEGNLSIEGKSQQCPNHIFTIPINANFKINMIEFVGTNIDITHQETKDPLFSLYANWHMQPYVKPESLLIQEPAAKFEPDDFNTPAQESYHEWSISLSSATMFFVFVLLLLGGCKLWTSRNRVTVTAKPQDQETTEL